MLTSSKSRELPVERDAPYAIVITIAHDDFERRRVHAVHVGAHGAVSGVEHRICAQPIGEPGYPIASERSDVPVAHRLIG